MVISDKPVESWTDKDALSFEINLGEMARRFKRVESIIELAPDLYKGFEAKKVTITHQDGTEFSEVLWLDSGEKDRINAMTREIKDMYFKENDKIKKALLFSMIEDILSPEEEQKEKEKGKKYGG